MQTSELDKHLARILELTQAPRTSVAAVRANCEEADRHQRMVADAYAAKRGWHRAPKRFPPQALARVSLFGEEWEDDFADHRYFWTVAGHPVAVCAHLYGCDAERREAAQTWAASRGLRVSFPNDFPSWWYPSRTTLIEITRAA